MQFLFPLLGSARGVMFLCRPCVCVSVCDVVSAISPVCNALMDFFQTYVSSASWDKGELFRFLGRKGQTSRSLREAYRNR